MNEKLISGQKRVKMGRASVCFLADFGLKLRHVWV